MVSELTDAFLDDLLATVGPGVDSPILMVQIRHLNSGFYLHAVGIAFGEAALSQLDSALDDLIRTLQPHASGHVLLSFLGDGDAGPERTRAAYSAEQFAQLQAVKAKYDPENRFRFNHNITPV
jgi:hypothetical protein